MTETKHETIIIGAGPAGLAVGACLKQAKLPFTILEQSDKVGSAWHNHYDRLHLHTARAYSGLPYWPMPADYPRYPSRLQLIAYLENYANHFQLPIRFGQQVVMARPEQGLWQVETQDNHYQAAHLVVAAGYTRQPHRPQWPGLDTFGGTLIHSSQYRNGQPFQNQDVLVVGFGNSGGEIAVDLWEQGARPAIAVRSPVNVIPRELLGIPILAISIWQSKLPPRLTDALNAPILRLVIGDLTRYGLRKLPHGPATQIQRQARIPLIDVGTIELIKRGQIEVYPGLERFQEGEVLFADGRQKKFAAIVLATGYRPQVNDFLTAGPTPVYDSLGTPLASGQEAMAGLYFCGYYVSPTGMLREIGLEAQRIGAAIAR